MCRYRMFFESKLVLRGLKLERELGRDNRTVFVKIHVPQSILEAKAEAIELYLPLDVAYLDQSARAVKDLGLRADTTLFQRFYELFSKCAKCLPSWVRSLVCTSDEGLTVYSGAFQRSQRDVCCRVF